MFLPASCRPDDYPPYPPPRGQAIVEFALILPLIMAIFLGAAEMGLLYAARAGQDRATGVLADWAAAHPGEPLDGTLAAVKLDTCDVTTVEALDIVTVDATCAYRPRITANLWDGLPISSTAQAAVAPTPTPTPTPAP